MQYAWGHATSGFTSSDPLYGTMAISLSLSAVLLILWALQSFRRRPNAGTMGVVATIIDIEHQGPRAKIGADLRGMVETVIGETRRPAVDAAERRK